MFKFIKTFESFNSNTVIGYRYINQKYNPDFESVQFFAKNKNYAKIYGEYLIECEISLDKAMFLENWNILLRENGVKDFGGQGILTIHSDYFNPNSDRFEYSDFRNEIYHVLGINLLSKFIHELRNSDVIIGKDAGQPNEVVYAVKNKNAIIQ